MNEVFAALAGRFLQKNDNKANKQSNPTTQSLGKTDPMVWFVSVLAGLCFLCMAYQWCCGEPASPKDDADDETFDDEAYARQLARTPPPPRRPLAFERSRSRPRMPRSPPLRQVLPLGAIHTPGGTLDMEAHRRRSAENDRMLQLLRARQKLDMEAQAGPPSAVFIDPDGTARHFATPTRSGYDGAAMQRRLLHTALGGAMRTSPPPGPPTETYRMPSETRAMAQHRARHAENERMLAIIRARERQQEVV